MCSTLYTLETGKYSQQLDKHQLYSQLATNRRGENRHCKHRLVQALQCNLGCSSSYTRLLWRPTTGACAAKSAHCMVKVFFAAYHTAKVKFALNVVQYTQNGQQCNAMQYYAKFEIQVYWSRP